MLSGKVRILNFDDSVARQNELLQKYSPQVIDLTRIASSCRLWSGGKCADLVRNSIDPREHNAVTFLGSGDFHHISSLLIEQFTEPLGVIIFDFHPDWDILPPRLGCGSWVSNILRRKNIKKVLILGASSEDLSFPAIQSGDLHSLKDERVEIYPYSHKPTPVLFRGIPENPSIKVKRGSFYNKIYWRELREEGMVDILSEVFSRMPVDKIYVSIDKDSLNRDYALTNWEEGRLRLEELLSALWFIKEKRDIAGMDITGEYSVASPQGGLKSFFSRLDHPKDFTAKGLPPEVAGAVNQKTNLKILESLAV